MEVFGQGSRPRTLLLSKHAFLVAILACALPVLAQQVPAAADIGGSIDPEHPLKSDISLDVNLVLVPVTVTDLMNRPVLGLNKEAFTLYEDKQPEEIRYFFSDDAPISVGLVLDFSGSMVSKVDTLRESIRRFLENANPDDEYYVATVHTYPKLIARGTRSVHEIEQKLSDETPKGATALLDATDLVLRAMHSSSYERRVVVIISDGGDNDSHLSLRVVRRIVEEENADVYALLIFDGQLPVFKSVEEKFGKRTLTRITDATGGRTLTVDNLAKVPKAVADLSLEIRSRYVLGYRPNGLKRDSSWHRIRVEVKHSLLPNLRANYRKGYSAEQ